VEILKFVVIVAGIPLVVLTLQLAYRFMQTDRGLLKRLRRLSNESLFSVFTGQIQTDSHLTKQGMGIDKNGKLIRQCGFSDEAIDRINS
jgi:hypothetical protein